MRKCSLVVIFLFLSLTLLCPGQTDAQQINGTLFIQPFPSPYPGEWQTNPSIGYLTLNNRTGFSQQVVFELRIARRAGGTILTGKSSPQTLPSGAAPTIFNNTQFLNLSNVTYDGTIRSQVIRSGRIPEGEYIGCIDIKDLAGQILQRNVCSQTFTIVYPDAPQLISPVDRDSLALQYPIFAWTPTTVPPAYSIHYELTVVELLPGQVPAQALAANVPPHYVNRSLTTTTLIYPIDALPLAVGKKYTWWVQVIDQNGFPASTNNGRSQIFTFVYKGQVIPPPPPPRPSEGSLTLTAHSPQSGAKWTNSLEKPKFIVNVRPAINFEQLQRGTLRVWKMDDSTELASTAMGRAPAWSMDLDTSEASLGAEEIDSMLTRLEVKMDPDSSFSPEGNAWYWWKFGLKYNQASIRRDSVRCSADTASSQAYKFKYEPRPTGPPGACRDVCSVPAPRDVTPASVPFVRGDTVKIGRFDLILTEVSGSAASTSGKGEIKIPIFKGKLAVKFSGIKINRLKQVYDGEVTGEQAESSPLSEEKANGLGAALDLTPQEISAIYTVASQATRLVRGLTGNTAVTLPIGLDNEIGGQQYVVGIIGMVFKPTAAYMNMAMSYPMADWGPDIAISLGARNICFSPTGIGGDGNVQLYLPSDIGYTANESWSIKFLKSTSADSGCYVSLDCKGFKDLRLSAQVEFPRAWLRPFPTDDGVSKVKAFFGTHIARGGNFIVAASMDKCEIASAPGFVMEVQELTFDKSDEQNPAGIVFPADYVGVKDDTWKGFYIKRASISLPPQLRTFDNTSPPQIAVQNLLINRSGVTGSFRAENVFMYPKGNFGDWGGSLDTLAIEIVSSSLRAGWLKGKIKIPISADPLLYSATLSRPGSADTSKKLIYAFVITPGDSFSADIWKANVKLEPTSAITLGNDNPQRKMIASAVLTGTISIAGTIGRIPNVKFPGVKFQNMKLQSVKPYFTKGTFSFASPEKGIAGFPVSISNIDMENTTREGKELSGIKFTVSVNVAPGSNAISGSTTLKLWGELDLSGGGQKFKFNSIQLDAVAVNADLGPVSISGSIQVYNEDPVFGSGFRGALRASILKRIDIMSTVQFGQVSGFRYFYVDAKGIFNPGIPFGTTGVGFYGFGGGFWWNMRREGTGNPAVPTSSIVAGAMAGETASGMRFVPNNGTFGFKAMVVLGTHPSSVSFNCDVILEIELQRNVASGSISMNRITLQGKGYMMAEVTARQNAKVTMVCDITYNFPASTLHGVFQVAINASPVTGGGQMVVHVEPSTWYIKVGEPSSRINLQLASWLRANAYLMIGKNLPPPPPPPAEVLRVIGSRPPATRDNRIAAGSGFAFGASFNFNTGRQTFLIFYGQVSAGAGFDIAVLKQTRCTGINGWQAQGQIYAYINAAIGLYVDVGFYTYYPCGPWYCAGLCKWCRNGYVGYKGNFEILKISAVALLEVGGPNPLWVKGTVAGQYNILGGLVKGNCSFKFNKGTECRL